MKFNKSNFVPMGPRVSSRIKTKQRQEIVEEYAQGKTVVEIGTLYGISRQRVYVLLKEMKVSLRNSKRGSK